MPEIIKLEKSFKQKLFSDFSYKFEDKGLYVIRGESGKGKTTLLRILAGLDTDYKGELKGFSDKKISFLFQDSRLLPFYTLYENIALVNKEENPEKIKEILNMLSLSDAANLYPDELSGGMKHRGAIARSVYFGGDIFLWDEPTKELDRTNADTVISIMKKLACEKLVIAVSHDEVLSSEKNIITL